MTNHDSKVYTLRRLAARWRCSPQHVRNMCEAGKLDAFKLGGKLWRIRADSVAKVERAQAMAIALSDDEVGFLKLLGDKGGELLIGGNVRHEQWDRVVAAGLVERVSASLDTVVYVLTPSGREALTEGCSPAEAEGFPNAEQRAARGLTGPGC